MREDLKDVREEAAHVSRKSTPGRKKDKGKGSNALGIAEEQQGSQRLGQPAGLKGKRR